MWTVLLPRSPVGIFQWWVSWNLATKRLPNCNMTWTWVSHNSARLFHFLASSQDYYPGLLLFALSSCNKKTCQTRILKCILNLTMQYGCFGCFPFTNWHRNVQLGCKWNTSFLSFFSGKFPGVLINDDKWFLHKSFEQTEKDLSMVVLNPG